MPPTCDAPRFPEANDPSCGRKSVWKVFNKTVCAFVERCDSCLKGSFVEGNTYVVCPTIDHSRSGQKGKDGDPEVL